MEIAFYKGSFFFFLHDRFSLSPLSAITTWPRGYNNIIKKDEFPKQNKIKTLRTSWGLLKEETFFSLPAATTSSSSSVKSTWVSMVVVVYHCPPLPLLDGNKKKRHLRKRKWKHEVEKEKGKRRRNTWEG
jgi:hypothetical protein